MSDAFDQAPLAPEPWILILDDDEHFRALLSGILTNEGYTVYEARSAKEATESLRLNKPYLAIVDYRLPETDGVTWITRVRESGNEVPIVFLSGTFCDASTFQKLRNILKVSLILQKPIVPELFLDQIEPLLPRRKLRMPSTADQADVVGNSPQIYALPQVKLPQKLDQALQEARRECLTELPGMVKTLAEAIQTARESNNRAMMNEAANEAHKIKGSAGSFGFDRVAEGAAKIETLLSRLEPDDSTMQEILWSEIIHHLADAESSAAELTKGEQPEVQLRTQSKSAHSVLLITRNDSLVDVSLQLSVNIAEAVVVHKLSDGLLTLRSQRFDAVIVDQQVCESENILEFIQKLREIPGHEAAPLAIVLSESKPFNATDILYLGCSLVMKPTLSLPEFEEHTQRLISLYAPCMPRILSVDDDPVLSNLIKKVLTAEGMTVQTLNEPIRILDTLQEFKPDIVLLDVIMPGLSGYDVCRMLRAVEQWRELIIIFLTSKSDEHGRASAFQAGGNDFLPKPVVTADLINRVKAQVQHSELIHERMDRDPVTGLLQRGSFESTLSHMVESAEASMQPLTVCLMELEGIELISQQFGQALERQIVSAFSKLLRVRFRAEDARAYLGDLFFLALENVSIETAQEAVELFQEEFQNLPFRDTRGHDFNASLTFGMAQLFKDTNDGQELLHKALERLRSPQKAKR